MATPLAVTDHEFEKVVLHAEMPVLVDFWAIWCASCRIVAPVLDELASEYEGRMAVVKVNVDENPEYATQYQVRLTPTIVFFRQGQEVDRVEGAGRKALYSEKIAALLG